MDLWWALGVKAARQSEGRRCWTPLMAQLRGSGPNLGAEEEEKDPGRRAGMSRRPGSAWVGPVGRAPGPISRHSQAQVVEAGGPGSPWNLPRVAGGAG